MTEVQFDEELTSYEKLLNWFWKHHDPTKQHKKQYKSAILYVDEKQKEMAERSLKMMQEKYGNRTLDTYVVKLDHFYQAENYHQKYWLRCQAAIMEKLNLSDEEMVSSPLAAKVNAFLAGYNNFDVLKQLAHQYKLDEAVTKAIENIARTGGHTSPCHI